MLLGCPDLPKSSGRLRTHDGIKTDGSMHVVKLTGFEDRRSAQIHQGTRERGKVGAFSSSRLSGSEPDWAPLYCGKSVCNPHVWAW